MLECAAAGVGVLTVLVADKRNWPGPKVNMLTVRSSEWGTIGTNEAFSIVWFNRQLRCSRSAFEEVCRVAGRWSAVVPCLGANAKVDLTKRVAITLNCLAHGCTMYNAGSLFGARETVAQTAVHQVVAVLGAFIDETIRSPSTQEAWSKVCRGLNVLRICQALLERLTAASSRSSASLTSTDGIAGVAILRSI
jgi:hypothetical protein